MARQFTKGVDLVRAQKARFKARQMSREAAMKDLAEAGKQDAIDLVSGGYSKKQTRGAFARGDSPSNSSPEGRRRTLSPRQKRNRALAGSVPLLPINVQSGKLRKGIKLLERTTISALSYELSILGVPYAQFILGTSGTKKMVARGFKAEIKRRQRARMAAFVQTYYRKQRS